MTQAFFVSNFRCLKKMKNPKTKAMSTIVPETMTKEVLKKSLAANGLPDYGSRQEMYDRLLSSGEKKKPGPKPKVPAAKKAKPLRLARRSWRFTRRSASTSWRRASRAPPRRTPS